MQRLLLKNLKEGDIFYECEYGINVKYRVICDPYHDGNGWRLQATCLGGEGFTRGETIDFFTADGWEHYLQIYPSTLYID